MHRRSVLAASAVGAVAALAWVVFMVVIGSDVAMGYILLVGVFVGLTAAALTGLVLWLVGIANRPGE